jgi:hypothetical protein
VDGAATSEALDDSRDESGSRYVFGVNDEPYRAPMSAPPDRYMVAWADLRRRRRWYWIAWIAFVVTGPILCRLLHSAFGGSPFFLLAVTTYLMPVVARRQIRTFCCPGCGARFGQRLVRNECDGCGLRFGTPESAVRLIVDRKTGEAPEAVEQEPVAEERSLTSSAR